jgi:hypothetical protein
MSDYHDKKLKKKVAEDPEFARLLKEAQRVLASGDREKIIKFLTGGSNA